jgi:hypothetical protein
VGKLYPATTDRFERTIAEKSGPSKHLTKSHAPNTLIATVIVISGGCVCRKLKPGRNDGEGRRGSGVNE